MNIVEEGRKLPHVRDIKPEDVEEYGGTPECDHYAEAGCGCCTYPCESPADFVVERDGHKFFACFIHTSEV